MQANTQVAYDEIIRSSEQLSSFLRDLDMIGLDKDLPEYTQKIEQYFLDLDKEKLTTTDIKSLEQLMDNHQNLVTLIAEKKEKVSINIKQLHTGKEMQNTYPKTAL